MAGSSNPALKKKGLRPAHTTRSPRAPPSNPALKKKGLRLGDYCLRAFSRPFEPCPEEEGIKTDRASRECADSRSSNPALKKKGLRLHGPQGRRAAWALRTLP